jgi:ABC-type glycerol-3-phosphate transport system permease component
LSIFNRAIRAYILCLSAETGGTSIANSQYIANNLHSDLIDAARIDGCSEFGIYWRIALPVACPALAALGILFLIGIWNNLMWAFIVLRTEDMYILPLMIYLLHGEL